MLGRLEGLGQAGRVALVSGSAPTKTANLYILPASTFIDGPLGPAPAGLFFGSPAPQEHQVNAGRSGVIACWGC